MILFCLQSLLLLTALANKKNLFKPNKVPEPAVQTCSAASEVTITDPFGDEEITEPKTKMTVYVNNKDKKFVKKFMDNNIVMTQFHDDQFTAETSSSPPSTKTFKGTPNRVREKLAPYNFSIRPQDLNMKNVASIYWNANLGRQPYRVERQDSGSMDDYIIGEEIGSGTFSKVYLGTVVMKSLRKIAQKYIDHEIQILRTINNQNNIVKLLDVIFDPRDNNATLVFNFIGRLTIGHKIFRGLVTPAQRKTYLRQLFKALDTAHSLGVMHRDIKPYNIIVGDDSDNLELIDWGVGELYYPMKEYSTTRGTRHYRAPELLVHYRFHDYAVDVWAVGIVMAQMYFGYQPLFRGESNDDQLVEIVKFLGSNDFFAYLHRYDIKIPDKKLLKQLKGYQRSSLTSLKQFKELDDLMALDLLDQIFVYDHKLRITAEEALKHPYFH